MAKQEVKIQFEGSPLEAERFKKTAQKLANLPADHRGRVSEIIANNKALDALKNYWGMLQEQFS